MEHACVVSSWNDLISNTCLMGVRYAIFCNFISYVFCVSLVSFVYTDFVFRLYSFVYTDFVFRWYSFVYTDSHFIVLLLPIRLYLKH